MSRPDTGSDFQPRAAQRGRTAKIFRWIFFGATTLAIVVLAVLLLDVLRTGATHVSWRFIVSYPSRFPESAGILVGLLGSLWTLGLTALLSFPLGIATAIWLEEYAPSGWLSRTIQMNIANLASVPSVVYGILGLALFVQWMNLGRSILAGSLTLTLLILPVIIISSQEAIRSVPKSIRLAAFALGATRWQTVSRQVFPAAIPGILTGTILALSRAVGETAPLILIGAAAYVPFAPVSPMDEFTVLPIQIFNWISRPQPQFHQIAAAGIIVLLIVLLSFNLAAILLRNHYSKR
ncbi:MAG: phosphate ABC transporter permease PstA [Gemmatimonadota bacterium]|jgi:phosphate transport system permease protein|nr:phosphate ABC transporter permease PstA [Gemmatimonadota bacterium]